MTSNRPKAKNSQTKANLLLDQLRRDVQTLGPWSHRFQTLIQDTLKIDLPDPKLTCADTRNILDVYIDDESNGQDVRLTYPDIWRHLQTCAQCQRDHDVLLSTLHEHAEQAVVSSQSAKKPLPFLQPQGNRTRWISRVQSQLAGASFGLHILLNLQFLKNKLGLGPSWQFAEAQRSDTLLSFSEPRVLLIDDVPFDGQRLNIEIRVARLADKIDRFALLATLVGSAPLPDNLWIQLTLAEQTYAAPVIRSRSDEGHAQIDDVLLDDRYEMLNATETHVEIVIEVREIPPNNDHSTISA
ncbi:hypothetical protein TFLX_03986 [Thermoflexales bacterium]|nr:hypothetical protein TFLX_03986 [Thermoflexales bacterium]